MKEKEAVEEVREESPIQSEKKKRKVESDKSDVVTSGQPEKGDLESTTGALVENDDVPSTKLQPENGDVSSKTDGKPFPKDVQSQKPYAPTRSYEYRLHYRWSQLEADRSGVCVGSPQRPLPKPSRVLHLDPSKEYSHWPEAPSETPAEQARFSMCADVYKTIDYNTFQKNGALKLTEIEFWFLSSKMTRKTSSEWAVVYLGVGNGERFRYIRDEFFPDLMVVAYDPLDEFYTGNKEDVHENSKVWNSDGTNFYFHVRCFEDDKDIPWMQENLKGRRLLLISDIRGVALTNNGSAFDKHADNDLQWDTIKKLRPVSSICKFVAPNPREQFYDYVPGTILKQIYCNYGTLEARLLIEGVPEDRRRYNGWEIYEKMMYHHEHLRGQVYETTRRPDRPTCLDCSFDCAILWDTLSTYAEKNDMDPYKVLDQMVRYHIYTPTNDPWKVSARGEGVPAGAWERWYDVEGYLRRGDLEEAVAALDSNVEEERDGTDWADIVRGMWKEQPELSARLKKLSRPASRADLVEAIGSLSEPFTLVRTGLNALLEDERY